MKHLFVPYEIALLAEKNKFGEECFAFYSSKELKLITQQGRFDVTAPLYQQLIDWFRDEHKIVIYPDYPDCNSLPVWRIKWHTNAYMERFVSDRDKALEEAFKLIP